MPKRDKRHVGLIAPPFKINFLATENLPKMKLKTDGQTDNSALEKFRCLSAGGAKNSRVPPTNMTEHGLKFHNGQSMCSQVILNKRLKYNRLGSVTARERWRFWRDFPVDLFTFNSKQIYYMPKIYYLMDRMTRGISTSPVPGLRETTKAEWAHYMDHIYYTG